MFDAVKGCINYFSANPGDGTAIAVQHFMCRFTGQPDNLSATSCYKLCLIIFLTVTF